MPTYTNATAFVQYVPGFVIEDADALDFLLEKAEEDIDSAIGRGNQTVGARKFDVTLLTYDQAEYLSRAVCAQAEYRLHMGDTFFIEGRPKEVRGRDGSIRGPLPYIGPKAKKELTRGGLYRLTNAVRNSQFPNQNVWDIIP